MSAIPISPALYNKSYPTHLSLNASIPAYPLFGLLETAARTFGTRPAFDFLGHKLTWSDVYEQSMRLARSLQDRGIGKGRRVGLFLPNCPYFLIAYYAIARTGATIVNYNPLYPEKELMHQINDSGTDTMITTDLEMLYGKIKNMVGTSCLQTLIVCQFTDILPFPKNLLFKTVKGKELAHIPAGAVAWYHDLINHDLPPHDIAIHPYEDIALLQYTGGTTGVPKGAMLTHANVVGNAEQCVMWLDGGRPGEDKMLGVLPFFHVFAMTAVMNFSVKLGLEIIALPRFELDQTLKLIHTKKPHFFPAVPAIYNGINNHKKLKKYDLSSLKFCISGGAPLPVEVKNALRRIPDASLLKAMDLPKAHRLYVVTPA